jgi:hypothetical protein
MKIVEYWEVGGKGVRESNGKGRTDQRKVYPQQGDIDKTH